MKVDITPQLYPVRGGAVKVGNVYANNRPPAFRNFRIVVGIVDNVVGRRLWNCVVLLHVDYEGNVVGSSNQPLNYVKDHWDLIGRVKEFPSLKIEWLQQSDREAS